MKLRFSTRYLWFTVQFLFWRIPGRLWVLLAAVQIVTFTFIAFEITNAQAINVQGTLNRTISQMRRKQTTVVVVAPVFLMLAKIRLNRPLRGRSDAI
jgi:hypothetical protein